MAKSRTKRSRGRSRGAKPRMPADWVETIEGWVNADGFSNYNLTANNELYVPLVNTYSSWAISEAGAASSPAGTFTRGLPWYRRKVLRVKGWVHTFSDSYFTGNAEMLATLQLQRTDTDLQTGTPNVANLLATHDYESDQSTYGKWQHYLVHNSSWTSPDDFTTFKKSFFINKALNVTLEENETVCLRVTWRCFVATPRLYVRPFLRTLVTQTT